MTATVQLSAIAKRVGVDEYYSEVLPEDRLRFVEKEKAAGRKVIMIGDGINDSPALFCGRCRNCDQQWRRDLHVRFADIYGRRR